ncbi:hypothetical protein [Halothece sp. PCC 7418]|uniref:hypothetical protein n=1 Tax=Halothece sp. (strain PCC 7418) TaxID=65093 RepID=UPI0002E5354E|nr:hypothetical protein [Halothece sp. PCC 7418]
MLIVLFPKPDRAPHLILNNDRAFFLTPTPRSRLPFHPKQRSRLLSHPKQRSRLPSHPKPRCGQVILLRVSR